MVSAEGIKSLVIGVVNIETTIATIIGAFLAVAGGIFSTFFVRWYNDRKTKQNMIKGLYMEISINIGNIGSVLRMIDGITDENRHVDISQIQRYANNEYTIAFDNGVYSVYLDKLGLFDEKEFTLIHLIYTAISDFQRYHEELCKLITEMILKQESQELDVKHYAEKKKKLNDLIKLIDLIAEFAEGLEKELIERKNKKDKIKISLK